jgi:Family of unknown function (DUF5682)
VSVLDQGTPTADPAPVPAAPPGALLLGIRHHGPGSARAVAAALREYRPDRILIEGPADADPLLALVGDAAMEPPVALLAYREADPKVSAFWPFAAFSPEWTALRYGAAEGVPVAFCDLPACASLAMDHGRGPAPRRTPAGPDDAGLDDASPDHPDPDAPDADAPDADAPDADAPDADAAPDQDPITALATAAGYEDPESWWEDVIEHSAYRRRAFGGELPAPAAWSEFEAVGAAMAAVREGREPSAYDAVREAQMRTVLRAAVKSGAERIAVVCGAYHVPALADHAVRGGASADKALLATVPKPTKATAASLTWVPWTHSRLGSWSGYGAGITSPGWYRHLFETDDRVTERWLTAVADLLRGQRHPVSSAHIIEATRLAEALAALRGRPMPGLPELTEATRAVLCEGRDEPLSLIGRELIVGEALGAVPEDTPTVPLAADLAREAKRLRLPKAAASKKYDLDLRNANDLDRSRLFHRLALLGVDWAVKVEDRSTGTFRESWEVAWEPVFEVKLVEAALWGTTVPAAATARALDSGAQAPSLGSLTVLVERCLTADLADAAGELIEAVKNRAALDTDLADLAAALPPLARVLRYGDVRGTSAGGLGAVVEGVGVRIALGLPGACVAVDDAAAGSLLPHLGAVQAAIQTLDEAALREPWNDALLRVAGLDSAHGLLRGRAVRLLADGGCLQDAAVAGYLTRALAPGTEPAAAAAWIEGFLAGTGFALAHDRTTLGLIDAWLADLPPDRFDAVLPLLRRTFGTFSAPERRTVADQVRVITGSEGHGADGEGVAGLPAADPAWAEAVLPTIHLLLTGHTLEDAA